MVARLHFVVMERVNLQQSRGDSISLVGGLRKVILIGLLAVVFWLSGCASKDPDDISARPWNSPRGWESGLPPGMFERR